MTTTTAAILSCEPTTLVFNERDRLACLYVIVDGRADVRVVDFLVAGHAGCDQGELDWQLVERPRSVLIGLELTHVCDDPALSSLRLRLVFDVDRDADALQHLAATEALVVGTRRYGAFANTVCAFGVDGMAVRRAVEAARRELATTVAVARTA
jgi:hypothetical protein